MRYPKLRELKEAVKSFFSKPYTTEFPYKPHTAFEGFRGKPVPNDKECIACGACAQVCPSRAIEIKENINRKIPNREVIWHYDLCIFCGQCERLCTTQSGVKLSIEYDLAVFNRSSLFSKIEKDLVICQDCGEILAPKAQLLWAFKKLGPLAFGNFNLIFANQKELNISHDILTEIFSQPVTRSNLFQILCPKCRHIAILFNQTGKEP